MQKEILKKDHVSNMKKRAKVAKHKEFEVLLGPNRKEPFGQQVCY